MLYGSLYFFWFDFCFALFILLFMLLVCWIVCFGLRVVLFVLFYVKFEFGCVCVFCLDCLVCCLIDCCVRRFWVCLSGWYLTFGDFVVWLIQDYLLVMVVLC